MRLFKKTSPRRTQVRKNIATERFTQISRLINADVITSALLWIIFVTLCVSILSFELFKKTSYPQTMPITVIVALISLAAIFYIYHYQKRIITNHARALALVGLFVLLLAITKTGILLAGHNAWATGAASAGCPSPPGRTT